MKARLSLPEDLPEKLRIENDRAAQRKLEVTGWWNFV